MTTIEFSGITFDDQATSGFTVARWSGWWDGAPMRVPLADRPNADGAFGAARNYRAARVVTVEGSYIGASIAAAYAAMQQLAAMQADGVPSNFRVTEPIGAKQAEVALARAAELPDQLYAPFFDWSFDVVAYDGRRYGDAVTVSTEVAVVGGGLTWPITWPITWAAGGSDGRVTITNGGTTATYPMFEITGGLELGFSLVEVGSGREIRFERLIPVGSTVFLNPRTGRASIDAPANDVSGYLTKSDWFSIPPATSSQIQFVPLGIVTGTPTLTARTAPAYW